jgi:hypothetical protein
VTVRHLGIPAPPSLTETNMRQSGNGSFLQTGDKPALETPNDFTIDWYGSIDVLGVANQTMFNHFATGTPQRSWMLRCGTTNVDTFISSTGTDQPSPITTPLSSIPAATNIGVRWTRRKSDGLVRLYTSVTDPPNWTKVAEATNNPGFTLFDSTANYIIGGHTGGTVGSPTMYFRRASVIDGFEGAGSEVMSPNVTLLTPGLLTSFLDTQGNTWTLMGGVTLLTRPKMRTS